MEVAGTRGLSNEGMIEWLGSAPCISVIILRTCPDRGRKLLTINKYLFVSFSPPGIDGVEYCDGITRVDSSPFYINIV